MPLESINPATGETLASYGEMPWEEVDAILAQAQDCFDSWRNVSFADRGEILKTAGSLLRQRKQPYGELMAREMGKPVASAVGEIEKCAWVCEHFAEHAEAYLEPEVFETDAAKSFVCYEPLGVMLAVMPWNFPFWQILRCAAPGLMAGNTFVVKPANSTYGCALEVEKVLRDAGLPQGGLTVLRIDIPGIEGVIRDHRVQSVTLTGSTRAGESVGGIAGNSITKCILELGGSDAFVVLEDADLDGAAAAGSFGRLQANGQSCIASKRFIVVEPVIEAFTEKLQAEMSKSVMGDPMDPDTTLGPLARVDLRDTLHDQVQRSVDAGAEVRMGGHIPDGDGAYYPATILAGVRPGMAAFDEELFGPVAAVIPAKDEAEAIALANQSPYGLSATVCSQDLERAERIARHHIQSGACFVNTFSRSDPRLPFGGIKQSGFGRELGRHGIQDLTNVKTVYIA